MSQENLHNEWLSLIEISGPFLAVPVLKEVFPQGLEALDAGKRRRMRQVYEEWRDALESDDPQLDALHAAWIDEVLSRTLELDEDAKGDVLKRGGWCAENFSADLAEHGVTVAPEFALVDEQRANAPLMFVQSYPRDVDLDATLKLDGWAATPAERMVQLCRAKGCRVGLVTNGERWMLVDAPIGAVTSFASWYARIWAQEPVTFQAFVHLLGIRRFFVGVSEQLPALFDRSLKFQDEVTDALGEQVRRAVEVLIQALDKADIDRDRKLLEGVPPAELYEAALTVMMRLVFLLSAEERGLLLLGDERYEANYALSTLRIRLRAESDEILERRWDAWSRLLALFRAVFGGIEHEDLRMPALGGSLFDPDRFPFLEGRIKGTNWRSDPAKPLPIDNRTVLLLLEAIQQFQGRTLSYRALDVEQIGYVYEGLLERTVKRTEAVTLELDSTKSAKSPWMTLGEMESARLAGHERLTALLQERSGCSASRIRNDLAKPVDDHSADRLLTACHGDHELRDRIRPFANFLRTDPWGYPLVYPKGAFIVTMGSDRRETGTHYTPKSLTAAIVSETLTPVAYAGPAEGKLRSEWVLKSPAELLDLKICDPAMGSGAFLVQACRWLAERLVEAWSQAEASGRYVNVDGEMTDEIGGEEPLPRDTEARTVIARRLIAERCLYGVDLNPLAVELAKLSIWLVTLAKGRPFGFLDHNLRCGDSLLGIHRLDQLTELSMTPGGMVQQRLFGHNVERVVRHAIGLRTQLRAMPIRHIHDVEAMASLNAAARAKLEVSEQLADAFIANVLAAKNARVLESRLAAFGVEADRSINSDEGTLTALRRRADAYLAMDAPSGRARTPFHWPLEFPEVFERADGGFDGVVGNPPFMGGRIVGRRLGKAYQEYLKIVRNDVVGAPDLCAYFFLRAFALLRSNGYFGLLATKSISETGSRVVCLDQIIDAGGLIYRAYSRFPWPGRAAVVVSIVWIARSWVGLAVLDDKSVASINGGLEEDFRLKAPQKLKALKGLFSWGQQTMGRGFELTSAEREQVLLEDPKCSEVIFPLFHGQDLNTMPELKPNRWIIYFRDWPEDRARKYKPAWRRVEDLVKPYRDSLTGQIHQDCFWKLWDLRPALMREFDKKSHVLAIARVTKHLCVSRVTTCAVYNEEVLVLFFDGFGELAVLQSTIHDIWARWRGGTLGASTLRFSTRAVLDPWPMPPLTNELEQIGQRYIALRDDIRRKEATGLTDLYNRFHSPAETSSTISAFRDLHRKMDLAVLRAFEWSDLDLEHDFREVSWLPENDRVRLTVSERAHTEVLRRLCDLNHQRLAEELLSGTKKSTATVSRRRGASSTQQELAPLPAPNADDSTAVAAPASGASGRRTSR